MQKALEIVTRYVVMVAIAVMALAFPIFYTIFRPLTMWPTAWVLGLFYNASISGASILIDGQAVEIIDACVAGSAYLLLLLLNLLTRDIIFKKRVMLFLLDSAALLVLNVLRLAILIPMDLGGSALFDITHKLFWYALSTAFVVLIWILSCVMFRIRAIPFISDVKFLIETKKPK